MDAASVRTKKKRFRKIHVKDVLATLILWALTLTTVFPFLWMVGASFKKEPEVFQTPFTLFPKSPILSNYITVWANYDYPRMFFNSVFVVVLGVGGALLLSCIAGYGFGRLKFPGREKIFLLYLAAMMIPAQLLMVPKYLILRELHLYNTLWGLIIPAWFSIYGVFMMRQFMMQIPESLSEAARIDGAGEWKICFQIIIPLCRPAIVTLLILFFSWTWNDYDGALLFIQSEEKYTLPLGLSYFIDESGLRYNLVTAASVITILPVFIVFLVAQKYFIGGLSVGAVKE